MFAVQLEENLKDYGQQVCGHDHIEAELWYLLAILFVIFDIKLSSSGRCVDRANQYVKFRKNFTHCQILYILSMIVSCFHGFIPYTIWFIGS